MGGDPLPYIYKTQKLHHTTSPTTYKYIYNSKVTPPKMLYIKSIFVNSTIKSFSLYLIMDGKFHISASSSIIEYG